MKPLTFILKNSPKYRLDLSILIPQRLNNLSLAEIAALPLNYGNKTTRVNTWFTITGEDTKTVEFHCSCNKLDNIGADMQSGNITIYGDVGAYLGKNLKNGQISVYGNVGIYAATGMLGGEIHIHGNAGDYLAAASTGERMGMSGGQVIVTGNAGDRVGDQLRRGVVFIKGNVGDYCGSRMIAGTIVVLGQTGIQLGFAMRRGTILLANSPRHLPVTFNNNGQHDLLFLTILAKTLNYSANYPLEIANKPVSRYVGDLSVQGQGEVLILNTTTAPAP